MQHSLLKRDPIYVQTCLRQLPDNRIVAMKPCRIYAPVHYSECGLAKISTETYVLGIWAMVFDDHYAVMMVNAMVQIAPKAVNKVKMDGDDYYEFVFDKGDTIVKNDNVVKDPDIVYTIFDEFFQKCNLPWFIGYEELGRIFDTAKKYAGANIGTEREITELITSLIARDKEDRSVSYRSTLTEIDDLEHRPPTFVPLMGVQAATNTMTRLGGSYFSKGLTSSLIYPSERTERIETILRK